MKANHNDQIRVENGATVFKNYKLQNNESKSQLFLNLTTH